LTVFRIALRTVFAKKVRLVSTALAVTLGVAFLAGTLVFTDTMGRTFDDLFADIYADTDTVVRSSMDVEMDQFGSQRGRIPESTIDTVRSVEGVARAEGIAQGFAQIVGADGDAVGNPGQGPPTFGTTYLAGALGPWVLTEGSREPGPGELVMDKGSADEGGLRIGDDVTVLTQTGPHRFPLVGTARFGSIDSPGGANVALFDLATAQEVLLGRTGEVDAVVVDAAPGVSEDELTDRIVSVLPDGQEALTGSEITSEQQDAIADAMGFFNTFLLVFAIVGLVVACFTIFNTFQIIITQRMREMALLRAIGAGRVQVLGAQLVEAVVVGLLASVAGLVLGFLVAALLKGLLAAFGVDVPAGGTVILPRTVIVALVVGTVVTVASAVFPALRASRIPPIAALRDVSLERTGQRWQRLVLGAAVAVAGLAGFVVGLAAGEVMWVGIGAFLTFLGVFILGPLLARPFAGVVGAPLPAVSGITGELARENAMRNPKRTSRTGGALMVGVALVVGITVIAASVKDWIRDIFDEGFTGDYVVSTDAFAFGGLSPELAIELNDLPEVGAATGVRVGGARVTQEATADEAYIAVDPATAGQVFDIGMVEGSVESLGDAGVLLDDDEADARQITVGDSLQFQFLNGDVHELTVEGIYTEQDLAGSFVITQSLHESSGSDQFDFSVYIDAAPGVSDADARAAIAGVASAYPNAEVQSRAEYLDGQAAQIDPIVNLMYALLALAIIIALFSIANSMALSIHERTREIGLLRAVGMTRRQTRSTVRWESVLVALLGTASGVLLGIFFGWSISVTIRDAGLDEFVMPVRSIAIVGVLAVAGAILATSRPAHRAARMNVLHAIAAE
jgi:putative ABC transport system permease protein